MKASTIIVSALASLVAAAPTEKKVEERGFSNFLGAGANFGGFGNSQLDYIFQLNGGLDQFGILQQLALQQNLGLGQFDALFGLNNNQNGFLDLNSILLLQQINDLVAFANFGVLGGFDLSSLILQNNVVNTGLLGLNAINLGQLVQPQVISQVQTIASQGE